MVSVAVGGSPERIVETFDRYEAEWTLLQETGRRAPEDLQPDFIPSAFIIDAEGEIVAAAIRSTAIDDKLEQLLQAEPTQRSAQTLINPEAN